MLIFIWKALSLHKCKLIGIALSVLFGSLCMVMEPYLLKLIIDQVAFYKKEASNLFDEKSLIILCCLFLLINILNHCVWRLGDYFSLKTFPLIKKQILSETFRDLSFHSYSFFQNNLGGDLVNKMMNITESIEDISLPIINILRISLKIIIVIIISITIHLYFSLLLIIWIPSFIYISLFLSKKIMWYSKEFAEMRSILTGKCTDSITNISNIRIFANERFEHDYLDEIAQQVMEKESALRLVLLKFWAVQGILSIIILGTMLSLLFSLLSVHIISPGDFAFIISITVVIIYDVFIISESISKIVEKAGVCKQAISTIYSSNEIINEQKLKPLQIIKADICFKNVFFGYTSDSILFNNINIYIAPLQKIGLVGYSGSGKSTFVNLIMRLFDIRKGEILINGQNIQYVTKNSLRQNIAFISQDPILFHRSLMENIRYGNLEANDQEVIKAAKKAYAHQFILGSPEGYNTLVGERGIKLSGGQRQRIAIARAILKNAPILILDEATSNLDSVTEALIQQSLKELMRNKTVIVIAHRLSTLLKLDRILVFEDGKIIEDGTHKDLIKRAGLYATLWDLQIANF